MATDDMVCKAADKLDIFFNCLNSKKAHFLRDCTSFHFHSLSWINIIKCN